uniref:Uncharacterized protein n=1 Tax=Acrobeloides nanus TaxID=290746 RepID=A0A914E142_9BILA
MQPTSIMYSFIALIVILPSFVSGQVSGTPDQCTISNGASTFSGIISLQGYYVNENCAVTNLNYVISNSGRTISIFGSVPCSTFTSINITGPVFAFPGNNSEIKWVGGLFGANHGETTINTIFGTLTGLTLLTGPITPQGVVSFGGISYIINYFHEIINLVGTVSPVPSYSCPVLG